MIGIDFGTSNSTISYLEDNNIKYITEINSNILIPTTLYFNENINSTELILNKDYYIGTIANEYYNINKRNDLYFYNFKRFLGITKQTNNSIIEFLDKYNLNYILDDENIYFIINNIKFSIQQLITFYLIGLKELLNTIIKENIVNITFPAYFTDLQKSQLKKSYENAGFTINKMYNEPSMAGMYYIYINNIETDSKLLILDIGGGTLDISVIQYHNESKICEVIDSDGNNNLGGIDIDFIIMKAIYEKYKIDKKNNKISNKIKKYAEEFKIKLSYTNYYEIISENIPLENNIIIDTLKLSMTRNELNIIINNLIDEMLIPFNNMIVKHDIIDVIFVGGVCEIPLLRQKTKFNNNNKNTLLYKTIVSNGSCIINKMLKSNFCLLDTITQNIGIKGFNDELIIMINKNSKIPISFKKTFTTTREAQRIIEIEVYEGNHQKCINNQFIGSYTIMGIPPNFARGDLLIELLFNYNINGLLNISINGFTNKSNIINDFNFEKNIKLVSNTIIKNLLRKLINKK